MNLFISDILFFSFRISLFYTFYFCSGTSYLCIHYENIFLYINASQTLGYTRITSRQLGHTPKSATQLIWAEARDCIFNKLPGDAEAAGLRTTLGGQFFPLLGLVLTAALKYLPAHTNIWVTLGFVSVVYLFHWEWVRFSYFFMCWPTSDWILDILNVMSWKLWVMLYSSPKCWFFCLRKQLTWSDSVSWEAT